MRRTLVPVLAASLAIGVLTGVPAQADPDGKPGIAAQAAPAAGRPLAAEQRLPDPSAKKVLTRPDAVSWPKGSTFDAGGTRVEMFDRSHAKLARRDGPVMRVLSGSGRVTLSYAQFAKAYGGDWGARLRLMRLPACAATTPHLAQCQTGAPLATTNDTAAKTLSADVEQGVVLAMTAGDASAQGDYKATKLATSSSWTTSLPSGAFSWNYPIRTPGTPGGLAPQIALGYSSQTVDGETSVTNNQGSWIGEGFTYEPGYLERRYKPCKDDGHANSGERCWARHNATIVLSGHSGELVRVDDNTWRLRNDTGALIQRLTGAANGDNDGEHWKLTTADGMQYFFGLNRLPGWSSGNQETNSTWTATAYGDDAGEPCNHSSGFSYSHCDQAWRWNLDHVIDVRGNVISYFYDKEINHYAREGKTDVTGTPYVRGGYLTRVDYGQRENQVYTTNAPARVVFSTAERCLLDANNNCTSYPDVPEDLVCQPGTKCKDTQASTTFFTRKRLGRITTEVRQGAGWSPVESWSLEHVFYANDDNSRTLWLKKLIHSGRWGGAAAMPAVEFDGVQLANRVDSPTDGIAPLVRFRLATVKTDSGSQVSVVYKPTDCAAGALPAPGTSTVRCYPVRWNPFGGDDRNKVTDWFHKHVVDRVVEDDLVGGQPDMVSSYEYLGDAAWRKQEPDGITKDEDLTWSDWRGYAQVVVRSGDGQVMPVKVAHFLLRGMGGTVTDSTGVSYQDHDDLSGHEYETVVYNGSQVVSKTLNRPWRHVTHSRDEPFGTREAALMRTDQVRNLVALGGDRWRETRVNTTHDTTWGRVVKVEDLGDVGKPADDRCTRNWYADNPAKRLHTLLSRTQTVMVACDVANPNLSTLLLTDTRTSYDLQGWGVTPTTGNATRTETLDRFDGTKVVYAPTGEVTAVDGYGRATSTKDVFGAVSSTEYTETDGLTTQIKTTNALDHTAYSVMDPAFGVATAIVDANGYRTEMAYDPLGRLTAVWAANRSRALGASPSMKYTYRVRNDKASVVTTESLANDGTYRASHEIYDGVFRLRQTQTPGKNGWLLTDTFYTGTGNVAKTNGAYLATGAAGDAPIIVPEGSVNGQTIFAYDGAGRVVTETTSVSGAPKWSTTYGYGGDRTHVDPPAGGVPTTTVTDARGNTVEMHQYHGDGPSGAADVTRYAYTRAGLLDTVTDAMGNTWKHHYNQRGQKILSEDPDAGDTAYTYDDAGRVASVTNGRGRISNKYDELGRLVETWQGEVGTGTKLTTSGYDTKAKGKLYYTARHTPGGTYYTSVEAMDKLYRPLTTRHRIPSGDVGTELGTNYDFTTAYNNDGTIQSVGMPAAGGLSAETLVPTYDALKRPVALTGATTYVTAAAYSNIGELLQVELHTGGTNRMAWRSWEYERGTGRLLRAQLHRQDATGPDMDAGYVYDAAGNVKSIADTPAGGQRDVQCFDYDYLRRMTRAWTTADTCDASPMTVGGPAPYHHSWTFDKAGNRATETIHGTVDTVRNYTYPDAGQGQNQPHTLRSISETGPGGDKSYGYSYDTSGSTTARPGQELTWDAEGRLATSKPTDGAETSYVYDANGNRIVRKEPGAITLFLGGMELRLDTATRAVTATRFYSFGGLPIGVRTPAGMFFQAGDHHGTNAATINAVSGSITWRRTLPYGGVRGAAPASWPDQKGFVGGTEDNTGLTHLGAREYDPLIGRFVSVDPIIDINDPQQMHGFAYAGSRPVTAIDASGLRAWDGDEEDDNGYPVFNPYCGDEWERSATADPGRAQRIREFRKKQILEGKYPDLLDTIKDFVEEIDRKTKAKQGRGGHMADAAEALWEAIFGEDPIDQMSIEICVDATLKRIDESRGNEGTKLGGGEQSGFGDKEFELAFILAWDGHEVVSKDKHYSPSGTVNTKAFDAWVDGVRSEFKTVGVDSPNTRQEVFRRANGKAAERLYIHAKNISPDSLEEGRKSFLRNSGSPDYTHYEVVGWDDTVGVDQWSRPLRSINTPVTCKKFLWWGCG